MVITPLKGVSLWNCEKAKIKFEFKSDNGEIKVFIGKIEVIK